jgi:hypothetical protein
VFARKYRTNGGCQDRIKTNNKIKLLKKINQFPESPVDKNS